MKICETFDCLKAEKLFDSLSQISSNYIEQPVQCSMGVAMFDQSNITLFNNPMMYDHKMHYAIICQTLNIKYRKAEYVQCRVCFVNVQSSLHENVVFSICARMCNAAYLIFFMLNSISGLDACYHFRLNISCEVAVTVGSHPKKYQVTF